MKGKIGLLIAVLLTAIMAVAGCKGESGGGSDAPSLPSIPLKNSNIRIERANDSWTESMSGIYTIGTATYAVTGTMNTVVTATTKTSPVNGTACNIEASSINLTINSRTTAGTDYTYFSQDASGNYYLHGDGDENGDNWITSPAAGFVKEIASPVSIGDTDSVTVTYADGDTETVFYVVAGKEYVSTGIANYESYKVNVTITANHAAGRFTKTVAVETAWIVPGLGIVKQEFNVEYYVGNTITETFNYTSTLTATNVSY